MLNLGTLPCGRSADISWVAVDSLLGSVALVKETPKDENWMAPDLENNIHEIVETNKKIFLGFEAIPRLESSTPYSASNSKTVS